MEYYNNPAKPITPPLILLWDFYWILKTVLLKVKSENKFVFNIKPFVFNTKNRSPL